MMGSLNVTPVTAGSLATPTEKPILTVAGRIDTTNKDDTAQFDRPMLEALGMVTVETTTPWYNGPVKFEGILLDKLLKHVGAVGERALIVALNDYTSEIPVEDFAKYNVILALKRNGEYMPVRDKGPLFVIYPFDSNPDLKSQTFYGRSVWQVAKIVIK
ncbi:molybdopterin-dependent oxidoreductase [Microvirga alba]|uniref:Molybdopterin-dependent oxidoreductase n=1 Tax=Microvirga alba TaxID=2791025 RepID=A0A931BL04_9HYPH|nr:molybdopterin-dependent oxidoreductase [Microvirga alba]MBF9233176.1 molybdopterin-dependent oxidoreductase [Microvirga alba]